MSDNTDIREKTIAAAQGHRERDYWLQKLSGELVKITFPDDSVETDLPGTGNQSVSFALPETVSSRLVQLSNGFDPRLYMVLTAGLTLLLYKYTGHHDIILGAPVFKPEREGNFINTVLALRNKIEKKLTFKELLFQVKDTVIHATENQNYPIETLLYKLDIPQIDADFPLFDVAILLCNVHDKAFLRDISFNILFSFYRNGESVEGVVEYNSARFTQSSMEKIIARLTLLLSEAIFNPDLEVSQISILSEREKQQTLHEFNRTKKQVERDKCYQQLFEESADRHPLRLAVAYKDQHMTFQELDNRANQLARLLRDKGITPNQFAGIFCARSIEMLIAVIAVFKAGGAYIPIDTHYPATRVMEILSDSETPVLLTGSEYISRGEEFSREIARNTQVKHIIAPDLDDVETFDPARPEPVNKPHDLAYMIYTSGTTGKPKGVMIHHLGMINHIYAKINHLEINQDDKIAQTAPACFDISVWQFLTALLKGGQTVIFDKEIVLQPGEFIKALREKSITLLESVPSLMAAFLDNVKNKTGRHRELNRLRWMIPTGEALSAALVRQWYNCFPDIRLVNAYGPTEASDDVTHYIAAAVPHKGQKIIPVGKPLQNLHVYILDRDLTLCPVGVRGEICIAGLGVGNGYWKDPGKTREAFIPNPYLEDIKDSDYALMYRTGDIGYFKEDGNIVCLGRLDDQVKIRGNRIQLGEIENRLLNHEDVKEAIVIIKTDHRGDKYLCAYIVPIQGTDLTGLREYLSRELPDYMVPSFIISLEKMPLTANGKIDRNALPQPETTDQPDNYIAPRNPVEKKMVEIWEAVLGKHPIGINENFFMIGGDSIKSIQVVSRMTGGGYKVDMKELFQYPTIAGLAPKVKKIEVVADQSIVTGTIPLTPIQEEFFRQTRTAPHHYNQAVMLRFEHDREIQPEDIKTVFTRLQEHHDTLRMTFTPRDDCVIQENRGLTAPTYPVSPRVFDLRDHQKAEAEQDLRLKANEIQASIHLEAGPLIKLGFFRLADGNRLLIVIHHLVIDGVSWRILLEDLETLLRLQKQGKPLDLPLKTTSYQAWAEKLLEYSSSRSLLAEIPVWTALDNSPVLPIKKDFDCRENYIKDTVALSFHLNRDRTNLLLTKVNQAYSTEINEILLTAVGLGFKKTFGNRQLALVVEGHGREEILEDVNVSRTIGWFTSTYPVLLDMSYEDDIDRQVKEVKERLRRIPNKGIGYGILKYLTPPEYKSEIAFKLKPDILFNYMGQFDTESRKELFCLAPESIGSTVSPQYPRQYDLHITGMIMEQKLTISIDYSEKQFKPETIETLLRHCREQLESIISTCAAKTRGEFTPADFTYQDLSIDRLDQLSREYSIEDIYTLSPMQEGMLFHSLYQRNQKGQGQAPYFIQVPYRMESELDMDLVEKSLNELIKRHDIFRTVFVHEGVARPIQVVLQQRPAEFFYKDLRSFNTEQEKTTFSREFKEKDKQRAFDLSRDVMIRLAILHLEDSQYEFTWSFHHILMDGWCLGIVRAEFLEIYYSLIEKREYRLPPLTPYKTYIQWIEKQDREKTREYWQTYLQSYKTPAFIPRIKGRDKKNEDYRMEHVRFFISSQKTRGLEKLARESRVTLNTIMQAIWGIILATYNDTADVVFGAVVSGRPAEIKGVESMVGLFINTIPVRIRFDKNNTFSQLSANVQEQAGKSQPYHFYSLSKIQAHSELKQDLLDHILVFENFPIENQEETVTEITGKKQLAPAMASSNVDGFLQTNYDFNIVIGVSDCLTVLFKFNALACDMEFVKKISQHLQWVIDQVLEDPHREIYSIDIISPEEKTRLIQKIKEKRPGNIDSDGDNQESDFQPGKLEAELNF